METGSTTKEGSTEKSPKMSKTMKSALLWVNIVMLSLGNCGGPLLQRLYFVKGGKRIWLACWLETAGFPFVMIPLLLSYFYRRSKKSPGIKLFTIRTRLFLPFAVLGLLTGCDDYLASYGVSFLPVSTYSIIIATQLAFTAGFAFLLVKQKFTAFTINSIVLLTIGAVVLAFHSGSDMPANESAKQYYIGFFTTLGASILYGFVLPMIELTYKKAKQPVDYSLIMETQMVISVFATIFCTIGMIVNHDFQAIPREAEEFELGAGVYYVVLICCAIFWQFFFLGATGVIFCASSLLSGIIIAALLPVTEVLAVLFFHEKFQVEKGLALALSCWGFVSYFYGEFQIMKAEEKKRAAAEIELH